MEEEWDYLIILDGCRYDYFKRLNRIRGKLELKISLGSTTPEFIRKNFTRRYPDVIYVSANPWVSETMFLKSLGFNPFFRIEEVWDFGWNEDHKTVLPETVTQAAIENVKKHPNKRIIIHYIQPHEPFINAENLVDEGFERDRSRMKGIRIRDARRVWISVLNGDVSLDVIKKAYAENLKIVLKEVKRLLEFLEGEIIITSDHGQCFGEFGLYSHPSGIYFRPLILIPWLRINSN
jgi:hypothetical protein